VTKKSKAWPISGKILVIDDVYEEVEAPIVQLVKRGIPVLYWNGKPSPPENVDNVRVIVIDLVLAGQSRGPGFYLPAIECLKAIPGPYVVILVSVDFQPEDPSALFADYNQKTGSELPGYVHDKGFKKDRILRNPKKLAQIIVSLLKNKPVMNLVFAWEHVLDRSKDQLLRPLVGKEHETTVTALIHTIIADEGQKGAARGFIDNLLRLQARVMTSRDELGDLQKRMMDTIGKIKKHPNQAIDNLLHWNLMYYRPRKDEEIRTGDIFRVRDRNFDHLYSIVLTPTCDFAHKKAKMILTSLGCDLNEALYDHNHPLVAEELDMVAPGKEIDLAHAKAAVVKKYLRGHGDAPQRSYVLWNFRKDWSKAEYTGICFDFKNVRAYTQAQFKSKRWKRICRLDVPFIDVMLQHFGAYSSRMGQPDVNKMPPYVPLPSSPSSGPQGQQNFSPPNGTDPRKID
jgi:hypothetical protein